MAETTLNWITVEGMDELATLVGSEDVALEAWQRYEEYKAAYKAAKAKQAAFQEFLREATEERLPVGKELKYGYMFGKLSLAVGDKQGRKPTTAAKPNKNLGSWLDDQAAMGRRS